MRGRRACAALVPRPGSIRGSGRRPRTEFPERDIGMRDGPRANLGCVDHESSRPLIVVLGDPRDPHLQALSSHDEATFVVGSTASALAAAAPRADAILAWWTTRELLEFV